MTTICIRFSARNAGLTCRDRAWALAFPHQSRKPAPIVDVTVADRPWAAFRRLTARVRRGGAGRAPQGSFTLARQAQDFSDLSWAMSLPAGRTGGAAAAAEARGLSCG
jgi:hypothetical protein